MQVLFAQDMQVKKNNYSNFYSPQKNISSALLSHTSKAMQQHPEFGVLPYNTPCKDCYELLDKRTLNERYFIKPDGSFVNEKAYGAYNYSDANGFIRAVDPHLYPTENANEFIANQQLLPTILNTAEGFSAITLKDNFIFRFNDHLQFYFVKDNVETARKDFSFMKTSVGSDGAWITNAWNGIDAEMVFAKGQIKTNFILKDKSSIDVNSDYLVIEEFLQMPSNYTLEKDLQNGYTLENNFWKGDFILKNNWGLKLLTIHTPLIIDQARTKFHNQEQVDAIAYDLEKTEGGYILRIQIKTDWLLQPERKYPVIIDPLLTGEATYTTSDIGFQFDNTCFEETEYCDYTMDILVPGKTTLTAAYFDGTYYSQNYGCFFTTDCLMKEAAFRILGICDDSPSPSSFWTCIPPAGDTAGTCYGVDLDIFNTVACVPPQCDDYEFTFEMRTFHCSCTKPPCDITCHYMPVDSWVITIEGRTVEENAIVSSTHPDFTICAGEDIDLFATGIYGVPVYTYEWLPPGITTDTLTVSPTTDTWYTSIIHDACDMQDTVTQLVTVLPAPTLAPGPYEGCYQITANAGAGYVSYLWSTGETGSTITIDSAGIYFVTVTDANGCTGTSDPISVIINTYPEIDAQPDTVFVSDGELAQLNVSSSSTGDVTFSWWPEENVTCIICPDPLGIIYNAQEIFYVTGEEFGCISPPDTVVVINTSSGLIVPNAFTPNADGLNDFFKPYSELIFPNYAMQIYNRWGELLFSTTDITEAWDGNYLDKEQEVGTYIWVIQYEKFNDKYGETQLKGTVTLLR
ncbi:MAG: gliding motility-associated C-terminal domain-containing protein [Bacteroidetes bacterium]|nr:gliding motility-associated C-terminal domain-containing protein [Bacteroidota bacterium]